MTVKAGAEAHNIRVIYNVKNAVNSSTLKKG